MIHNKCGGRIVIDLTSVYSVRSPSIRITPKGIMPGVVQIDTNKTKGTIKLLCSQCNDSFSTKEQYEEELLEACSICGENRPPQEIKFIEGLSFVCSSCIAKISSSKQIADKEKILLYFGEVLKTKEFPTLLTILMKK